MCPTCASISVVGGGLVVAPRSQVGATEPSAASVAGCPKEACPQSLELPVAAHVGWEGDVSLVKQPGNGVVLFSCLLY